ncbi:MAG: methylase [Sphingomonadales bacterium]|nr:methylase [Sphingomonadales bacterium]
MKSTKPVDHISNLELEYVDPAALVPDPRNARLHPKAQSARLIAAIQNFGFTNPILIDETNSVIAGHARRDAAVEIGLSQVPCIRLAHLTKSQKQALAIADNRLAELATWDAELLGQHLSELCDIEFDVELTGFDTAEIDVMFAASETPATDDPEDEVPPIDPKVPAVTHLGDRWQLDRHTLLCANAIEAASYLALLGEERAELIFTDPPYGVPIAGHVSGLGKVKHREFVMGGKMSSDDFKAFLASAMSNMAEFSKDGSIHYVCMDWRHLPEVLDAGAQAYTQLKNICVWDKVSAGMGSLYRSQHEMILVFKNGNAPHQNNVNLGRQGRYRTNVWKYQGLSGFSKGRDEQLAIHPTCKNLALVADAIRDCSKRNDLVLDPFAGSGTTILAAERTGRRAAAMELDPLYVDATIQRWLKTPGRTATLVGDGRSFVDIAVARAASASDPANGQDADHG